MHLTILVVAWNCRDLLETCLRSVFASRVDFTFEIVVVDNHSADGTVEMVRGGFPSVQVCAMAENLGFAKANNVGLHLATGRYVLLLNPDAVLSAPGALAALVAVLDQEAGIAAAGPRLVFPDGSHQVGDAGHRPTPWHIFCHATGLSVALPRWLKGLFLTDHAGSGAACVAVDWVCGACLLVRRAAVDRVGGLDERFFLYGEDVEWGCRMRAAGMVVAYVPGIDVTHSQGGSQDDGAVSTRWLDSLALLYAEMNAGSWWRFFKLAMTAGFALRAVAYAVRGAAQGRPTLRRKARAMAAYGRYVAALPAVAPCLPARAG